jgi:hypothetical protein
LDELLVRNNSLHHISILEITESRLTESVDSALLGLENYVYFSCDRISGRGGGVCVWCDTNRLPEAIPTAKHNKVEFLAIHLRKIGCILILIYIPPGLRVDDNRSIYDYVVNIIDAHLCGYPDSEIIVCRDFIFIFLFINLFKGPYTGQTRERVFREWLERLL